MAATLTPPPTSPEPELEPGIGPERKPARLFEPTIVRRALVDSFVKLNPRTEARNPVMFVVLIGAVLTTCCSSSICPAPPRANSVFAGSVAVWLWFTVLFANFAEAVAEGRGKAQADTLRKTRSETVAHRPPGRRHHRGGGRRRSCTSATCAWSPRAS